MAVKYTLQDMRPVFDKDNFTLSGPSATNTHSHTHTHITRLKVNEFW